MKKISWAVLSSLIMAQGLAGQMVDPPGGERPRLCLETDGDPHRMEVAELQGRNPMFDEEAPTPFRTSFTPDGNLLITELGGPVVLMTRDIAPVRRFGERGPGPGEYTAPQSAVMGNGGRVFVLDHAPPSLIVYHEDGSLDREIRLDDVPKAIHPVGGDVYLAAAVHPLMNDGDPLIWRYSVGADVAEPILFFREAWRGRRPYLHAPGATPILRSLHGRLYLGVAETLSIAEVDLTANELHPIVSGCLPDVLQEAYSRPYDLDEPAPSAIMIADYHVLADGRFLVRTGLVAEGGQRAWLLYSRSGRLLREWLLEPRDLTETMAAIDPAAPNRHFTWSLVNGESRLVRLAPSQR